MKDYAKIVGQSPVPNRPEVRPASGAGPRRPMPQQQHRMAPPPKQSSSKAGLWVIVGLIVLVVMFSAYRQHVHKLALRADGHDAKPAQTNQVASPQYDFYSVLPSGNNASANPSSATATDASASTTTPAAGASSTAATPVTATTPATTPAATPAVTPGTPGASVVNTPAVTQAPPATAPAAPPAGPVKYYLSAGSYSNSDDANQMLSQLLLVGVDASVVTTQDNGSPAYQVLVGPFASPAAYASVKQKLAAHQVQVSVVQQ